MQGKIMSLIKTIIDEDHQRNFFALEIAIKANVLKRCALHEHIILIGDEDIESAYDLLEEDYSHSANMELFKDTKDLKDNIAQVVRDESAEFCHSCKQAGEE
jgi:hypothetical protein